MRKLSSRWMITAALASCVTPMLAAASPACPAGVRDDIIRRLVQEVGLRGGLAQLHVEVWPEFDAATGCVSGESITFSVSQRNKGTDLIYAVLSTTFFT